MPGRRKGPPQDKTDWSLDGRGVDTVWCMAGLGRQRAARALTCAPPRSGLPVICFKLMFGELEFKGTSVLRIDFSLCDSGRDSGGLLERRIAG